jgi:alkylhydroperoxidase/carboxymuconolactone decarboxylase family protein YurZ
LEGGGGEAAAVLRTGLRRRRLPRLFFCEVLLQLSLLLGLPSTLDGFELLEKISPSRNKKQKRHLSAYGAHRRGLRTFKRIHGNQTRRVLDRLGKLHHDLPRIVVEDAYGRIVARSGLTIRERELINVVVLALGGYRRQLDSHIRGAIRVGVSRATMRTVVAGLEELGGHGLEKADGITDLRPIVRNPEQSL